MKVRPHAITALTTIALLVFGGCTAGTPANTSVAFPASSPSPAASVAASATAAATRSATVRVSPPVATLGAVQHSDRFKPPFTYAAPPAWQKVDEGEDYFVLGTGTPDTIALHTNPVVASNANDCEGLAAPGATSSVAAISATLSGDSRLDATSSRPVSIGGFDGELLDFDLAPSWSGTCNWSAGKPAALVLTVANPPGPLFGILAEDRARLILLEVGDDVVAVIIDSADGSAFGSLLSDAMPIVESIRFTP